VSEGGWLVVGLGNPGPDYVLTRHNAGYLVVDELAARMGASWRAHRTRRAEVADGRLGDGVRVSLAKPRAFMNEAGGPVSALAVYTKTPVDHLVAVHDDLDLEFGTVRVKQGGGDGGHNGLRSLRRSLGSGDFYRARVGIGRPPGLQDPADYVLSRFTAAQRRNLSEIITRTADAVEELVRSGLTTTQNRFHA
jgi:PTH1 family peptidyl-tRNA hydrolase